MLEPMQKATEDFQKMGQANFDAVMHSYGELNKGFQRIGTHVVEYSKQAFEDATRTMEKLLGVKSLEQAIEIQSDYAKKAYENWVAEATKIGEMYASLTREAYKPVEKAAKKAS
jgi:phasin family protein